MELLTNRKQLSGTIHVPADKSISHRSIMFGAISYGQTTVSNFLRSEDCLATLACFRQLGVSIKEVSSSNLVIEGNGIEGLRPPQESLDAGNSGTTMRLLSGILAGSGFTSVLTGDASLKKRPMDRIATPLNQMGAKITGETDRILPPLTIQGAQGLKGITYKMPVASAQVKSAILFAGLFADGETTIYEKERSRNHTEQMIRQFGGTIEVKGNKVTIPGNQTLYGTSVDVPGDISSAAFFLAAGLVCPESELQLDNVGINPTRTGVIDVIDAMGGQLTLSKINEADQSATLTVRSSQLTGTTIGGELIPRVIDELPILAFLATQASGTTIIQGAEELKVKETNRIDAVAMELNKMGASIQPTEDGMIIQGGTPLHGAEVSSHGDHRIGMMLQIAALVAKGPVFLEQPEAVAVSYPDFFRDVAKIGGRSQ